MKNLNTLVLIACAFLGTGPSSFAATKPAGPATMVLLGGKVMTMDAGRTVAQAVALRGNRIVAVGTDKELAPYIGTGTRVIALRGKTLLPGFIDGHVHPVVGAERLGKCSLDDVALNIEQAVAQIRKKCLPKEAGATAGKWMQVVNVHTAGFVANAADLDKISLRRPVILEGSDGHASWVNTAALKLANITEATPDPASGQIVKDAAGRPTGFLKDAAQFLVTAHMPPMAQADRIAATETVLKLLRSKGITSIQDASAAQEQMDTYETLEARQRLRMRVRAMLRSTITDDEAEHQRLDAIRQHFAGHALVRADGVKIFSDGVIEYPSQTAAMIQPYLDGHGKATDNHGGRYFDPEMLKRYVARLDRDGYTVFVHSIGDYTTRAALDAFQFARDQNGSSDNRHAITHLQMVDQADVPRFAPLGVYANMQLLWAMPSDYSIAGVQSYVSPESFSNMYPAASLQAAGATLYGGSDWPVDTLPGDPMPSTPLAAIQAGMLRRNTAAGSPYPGQVLNPGQRVSLDTMVAAYTINAARAMKQDGSSGSIEVGKLGDLVVLDSDLAAIAPEAIAAVKVRYTIFDGAIVHEAVTPGHGAKR